ncbi:hypothetical protein PMAYCL1PPCAC_21359, partial [Pristionchus mayeri]
DHTKCQNHASFPCLIYDWRSFYNEDGSWSFLKSRYKNFGFLHAYTNGSVYALNDDLDDSGHFWLKPYTGFIPEDSTLSARMKGQHCIKSLNGIFIGSCDRENINSNWVERTDPNACMGHERWYIEDHRGKVSLKSYCNGRYFRANR